MIKVVLHTIIAVMVVVLSILHANAQICVPDGQYTSPGIYPDTSVGFAPAIQCVYYEQLLTMVVPTDTLTCTIDSVVLNSLSGLPTGLSYGCSPASCGFSGGTSGCGLVYGTPTDTGTYILTASTTTYLSGSVVCTGISPLVQPFAGYKVVVSSPLSFTSVTNQCAGECQGTITVLHPALTPPITYQWDDSTAQTTNPAIGLCAGNYTVTLTDSAGCVSMKSFELVDPPAVVATISGSTNVTCNGEMDGTATAFGAGGTGTYVYMWSSGDTIAIASDLDTGTYMVTVTDASGCMDTSSTLITQPAILALTMNSTDATCGNSDGSASVKVAGGTTPYTYLWNDPGMQTDSTAALLPSGVYIVVVTDGNGCQDSASIGVNDVGSPSISLQSSSVVTCYDDCNATATVSAIGGVTPYTFSWSTTPLQTGTTATGLCGGTTNATVTDGLGCITVLAVIISEPSAVLISSESGSGPTCSGLSDGTITITAAGGTGSLTYSIDGGANYVSSGSFIGLAGGTYNIIVMDSSGCTDTGSAMTLIIPAALTTNTSSVIESVPGAGDGTATVVASGGTLPYTYGWSSTPGQTTAVATGLSTGSYQITVSDANGCSAIDSASVGVGVGIAEMIEGIEVKFYPNPANEFITIEINYDETSVLEIIDLVGKQIVRKEMRNKIILDVNSFKEGMYLYRISTLDGMKIHHGKMSIVK
ncbi:MAG TPA: T9SS type A sorting domain-containing protein [Flavobacteriales bacterium]|nr:T9SS type A sorting domain-containing protein [Flavobacteriales bacterium]